MVTDIWLQLSSRFLITYNCVQGHILDCLHFDYDSKHLKKSKATLGSLPYVATESSSLVEMENKVA